MRSARPETRDIVLKVARSLASQAETRVGLIYNNPPSSFSASF
jgi:hypothetical protein